MKISRLSLLITAATVAVACSESPTFTEDPVRAFAPGGGRGGGGGGGGGCSGIALTLALTPSSPDGVAGFDGDGVGDYVDGTDGVGASIQCDGNFDVSFRSGLKKNDPTIRFLNAHVASVGGSFPDVGPSLEETRFKSGNVFDVMAIEVGTTESVGLSITWTDAQGIRYQVRYGGTECAATWDDPGRYVTVDHPEADNWTFTGSEGFLCSLDTNDRKASAEAVGLVTAPFEIAAVKN